MLKRIRVVLALVTFLLMTLLFCDFTGFFPGRVAWLAKIQFVPALLAGSVGVLITLAVVTLLFGRIYCSVVCPFGILQDIIALLASRGKKNRFRWEKGKTGWRGLFLSLFLILLFLVPASLGSLALFLDPYSSFGRIVTGTVAPAYRSGNNLLAQWATKSENYAFYAVENPTREWDAVWNGHGAEILPFLGGMALLLVVILFAIRRGRLYCNTVCPVGSILGLLSRFSLFRPRIDLDRCNGCGLCARNCKASCIDPGTHSIDSDRCVVCWNCLGKCPQQAISYRPCKPSKGKSMEKTTSRPEEGGKTATSGEGTSARREFLSLLALTALTKTASAEEPVKPEKKIKEFDGGLAPLIPRVSPGRTLPALPPGSRSLRDFTRHCVGCQLCVSLCPNQVLRPSREWKRGLIPVMSFERGYCRPECVRCSEVCPAGAIEPITTAVKSATQIGYAVWVRESCVVVTDDVDCGNCERHCPVRAIELVALHPEDPNSRRIPTVDTERCIGCGECEYLCPARPTSAIYVEGVDRQREV